MFESSGGDDNAHVKGQRYYKTRQVLGNLCVSFLSTKCSSLGKRH